MDLRGVLGGRHRVGYRTNNLARASIKDKKTFHLGFLKPGQSESVIELRVLLSNMLDLRGNLSSGYIIQYI